MLLPIWGQFQAGFLTQNPNLRSKIHKSGVRRPKIRENHLIVQICLVSFTLLILKLSIAVLNFYFFHSRWQFFLSASRIPSKTSRTSRTSGNHNFRDQNVENPASNLTTTITLKHSLLFYSLKNMFFWSWLGILRSVFVEHRWNIFLLTSRTSLKPRRLPIA